MSCPSVPWISVFTAVFSILLGYGASIRHLDLWIGELRYRDTVTHTFPTKCIFNGLKCNALNRSSSRERELRVIGITKGRIIIIRSLQNTTAATTTIHLEIISTRRINQRPCVVSRCQCPPLGRTIRWRARMATDNDTFGEQVST